MKKFLTYILILAVIFSITLTGGTAFAQEETTINFYFTGDINGNALPTSKSIGYAKFKQYIDEDTTADHKFIFDTGNAFSGDVFANLYSGENIADIMKAVGYSEMALGYHDFNYGSATLDSLLQTANVVGLASNIFNNDNKNEYGNYKIFTIGNFEIGVFGISAPEGEQLLPSDKIEGLNFTPVAKIVSEAQKTVTRLKAIGADYVIALTHLGTDNKTLSSVDIATSVTDLDLIIDSKGDGIYNGGYINYPGYDALTTPMIVNCGENFESFGIVSIRIDEANNLLSVTSKNKNALEMSSYTGDPHITKLINEILVEQNKLRDEVVTQTPVFLTGESVYIQTCSTNLTKLVSTAIKEFTNSDIALITSDIIKSSIEPTDVTLENIINVVPNTNFLVTTKVLGKDLIDMLNTNMVYNTTTFPQFSGLNVVAEKYVNIDGINACNVISATIDGEAIDENTEYTIATTEAMYESKSGYIFENPVINKFSTLFDAVHKYFSNQDPEMFEELSDEKRLIILESAIDQQDMLKKLELPIPAPVRVSLTHPTVIPQNVVKALKGQDRYFYGSIIDEHPYTLYFNGTTIDDEQTIDLKAIISQQVPASKRTASSADKNAIYVDFSTNATIPEGSRLDFYVGDIYPPETVLYVYYYDINNDILELNTNGIIVPPDGYIDLPVTADHTYLLNSKLLNAALLYELPTIQNPYLKGVVIIFIIFGIWVLGFFVYKKVKKLKKESAK